MTPAIIQAQTAQIAFEVHEYQHDSSNHAYGQEAANKLGIDANKVFKTLVVALPDKRLAVGVVPVSTQLNLKLLAKAFGVKKAAMASASEVERSSGYVLGGVSPLGQKKPLDTLIDASAQNLVTIFVSAGRRGLEIELAPQDLLRLTKGRFANICQTTE